MSMDAFIRHPARATEPGSRRDTETIDDDRGERITPDADQGKRTSAVPPPISMDINDRIRRAAGINVRPWQRSVPEIGGY